MIVTLTKDLEQLLTAAAEKRAPDEACGLLTGTVAGDRYLIEECVFSDNVFDGDTTRHFEIDPALHLRLQRRARSGNVAIIGVWHSHPNGEAKPSVADQKRSIESNWVWLITATSQTKTETKAFIAGASDCSLFTAAKIVHR